MYVKTIATKHMRNLESNELTLSPSLNIFYGQNAQGKTNLLEAIYFCGVGRSHRTSSYKDLIHFNQTQATIRAQVVGQYVTDQIDIYLDRHKKELMINHQPVNKIIDLFKSLFVVIFSPEDLNIVSAGPQIRRKFIDINLCQINPTYYHNLGRYYNVLNQRNHLLKKCKREPKLRDTLDIWDDQLVSYGSKIMAHREDYLNSLQAIAHDFHDKITGGSEQLSVGYKPNVELAAYATKLSQNIDKDILMGSTSVGIHKDDLSIYIENKHNHSRFDVRHFGSQGQKRSVSLSLKLSGITYIKEKYEPPILLLDDVLSELDETRQRFLLQEIKDLQTILTCTGVEDVIAKMSADMDITLFKVDNGQIIRQ